VLLADHEAHFRQLIQAQLFDSDCCSFTIDSGYSTGSTLDTFVSLGCVNNQFYQDICLHYTDRLEHSELTGSFDFLHYGNGHDGLRSMVSGYG